jgi:hypothetical protein
MFSGEVVHIGLPQNRRFCGKRRSSEMNELSFLNGSEGYGACDDERAKEIKTPL